MTAKPSTSRPNILFIQADQHRFDCIGVNGHALLRTPALDRLAREGRNCTQAYTPVPLCSPARASMLTGCWPTRHGCIANSDSEAWQPPVAGLPSCSEELRRAGYQTAYVGKWHVDEGRDPTHYGFDRYVPESDYRAWRSAQGLEPGFQWEKFQFEALFGRTDHAVKPNQSRLAWGADRAIELIEAAADAPGQRPWFVRWDPSEPHLPNVVPPLFADLYDTPALRAWTSFPDPLEGKPYAQRQARYTWGVEDWTWAQWRPVVARYLGEIALLDLQIGRILDWLDRKGLTENTLVIYTSDHGDMCGAHGMMDKHFVMYDDVVRVPLLLRWPAGGISGGSACTSRILHAIDLPASILAAAGIAIPATFQGMSLLPALTGRPQTERADIMCMYQGNFFGLYSQRMVTDGAWKYVWNATDRDELYDLKADPAELRNLAYDLPHAEELQRWRHRLVSWMESIRDPLLKPWNRRILEEGRKAP